MNDKTIGSPVLRKEGHGKIIGESRFVDDLVLPDLIHGATVRSSCARGKIVNVHFDPDVPWEEFTIVTARDIPGENVVSLILDDQPYLADRFVNHAGEPVVLLAHKDKYLLEDARRRVRVEIEPLTPVLSIEESLKQDPIVWGKDNVLKTYTVNKGDIDAIWNQAEVVVEGEYRTGAQEQLYLETNGMVAVFDSIEGVTVWGSLQCPYYVHKALKRLFGFPDEKIRVIQTETGGGFGGKEEYPSMIAGHAALLAWKSGRPVKLVYDRTEDMLATTKRHPSCTKHRTALGKDGSLLGIEIDFVIDGGAYATLSPVVLARGTIHAAGVYHCPNIRIRSRAVATNTPPNGAFRGFGAPQSIFALERHFDRVAHALGLPPDEFRRRNFIQPGQSLAIGQRVSGDVDLDQLLDRAIELSDYHAKRERFAAHNRSSRAKKGIGLSVYMHGAGFTGKGEDLLRSVVELEATREGRISIRVASTEFGQGTNTILCQIAADALGIDYQKVDISQPDTAKVPNSGPTVASRTCMIVGRLVENAAQKMKETLLKNGLLRDDSGPDEFLSACQQYIMRRGSLRSESQYTPPAEFSWDEECCHGDAYEAYAWAVHVAEVTVDLDTYETKVDDYVAVQEVGKVIHPVLAEGQIEGGIAQGIGFALSENVVWRDGQMANPKLSDYFIPTAQDIPNIKIHFEEKPYARGPSGAKGMGEMPIDGPAPAIVNAIENATGIHLFHVPVTPESLLEAIETEAARD